MQAFYILIFPPRPRAELQDAPLLETFLHIRRLFLEMLLAVRPHDDKHDKDGGKRMRQKYRSPCFPLSLLLAAR